MKLPNTQPLVSIVTPSLNQGAFIADAIESVLAQDYPNVEYLVVDGGSRDETLDVLRRYAGRVRWRSEPDGGQADAINKGVALTRGEIVGWLNADDVYAPGAIARAVGELQAHPAAALVYGQAEFIDRSGTPLGPCAQVEPFDLHRLIHHLDFIVQPATFFRRAAFAAVGGLDAGLRYCLDYDLWIRLALRYPVRYLPAPLARARVYPETKTASGGLERLDEIERMVRRYGRRRLPSLFYGEMVRACWHAGVRALAGREWQRWRSAWGRGGFYFGAYLARKVRYGR
ncbi:MAG: glycosyltransferase [Kouleothrix sp.]|nr:glycosyltransferase [Kouleothrix sp.]